MKRLLLITFLGSLVCLGIHAQTGKQDTAKVDTTKAQNQSKGKLWICYFPPEPIFPGNYHKFVKEHLRYPKTTDSIPKMVTVTFFVSPEGRCSKFRVPWPRGTAFEKEAIRVLKKMPRWKWENRPKRGTRVARNVFFKDE